MVLAMAGCATPFGRGDGRSISGCAATPASFEPATAKARIVAIAEDAWRWWGERTTYRRDGRTIIEFAGGPWEHERAAFGPLAAYWCAAQPQRDYWRAAARDAATDAPFDTDGTVRPEVFAATRIGHAPFADAWSAAFVSWVMVSAGVPATAFTPAAAHWTYVGAIIRRHREAVARGSEATSPFVPHAPGAYRPKEGDLLCATRDGPSLPSFEALPARFQWMHCDIVVAPDLACPPGVGQRCLAAIGGNVAHAVTRTLVPLDRRGHVVRIPGGRDWIVVIESRLDRARPHAPAAPPA